MLCIFDSLKIKFHLQGDFKPYTLDLIAEGLIKKPEKHLDLKKENITASESFNLLDYYKNQLIVYDLRASDQFSQASIDSAINISKHSLMVSPETFLDKNKVYLVFGEKLSEDELHELRKHSSIFYYMSSDFQEWQIAAMMYFETKIK